jgi:hypothetical protein
MKIIETVRRDPAIQHAEYRTRIEPIIFAKLRKLGIRPAAINEYILCSLSEPFLKRLRDAVDYQLKAR